jgi:hypothetical protein
MHSPNDSVWSNGFYNQLWYLMFRGEISIVLTSISLDTLIEID